MTDARTDPVGALIDDVAVAILEFTPNCRRRLTVDERVARELAAIVVDLVFDWQPPAD